MIIGNIYHKYNEFCLIMDIQSRRIDQASSSNHIREIIQNRNKLAVKFCNVVCYIYADNFYNFRSETN